MLPDRRTAALGGGALALIAALALTGCAPVGADGAYGNQPANKPAANQAGAPQEEPAEEAPDEKPAAAKDKGFVTSSLSAKNLKRMGQATVDSRGKVLYLFTNDKNGEPSCYDKCAEAWPPVLAGEGDVELAGIDESLVTTVERKDGGKQLMIGKSPVYEFKKDKKGTWFGQGLQNKWFVIQPNSRANKSCLPDRSGRQGNNGGGGNNNDDSSSGGGNNGGGGYGY